MCRGALSACFHNTAEHINTHTLYFSFVGKPVTLVDERTHILSQVYLARSISLAYRLGIYNQIRLKTTSTFTLRRIATAKLLADGGMPVSTNAFCLIESAQGPIGDGSRMINPFPNWFSAA